MSASFEGQAAMTLKKNLKGKSSKNSGSKRRKRSDLGRVEECSTNDVTVFQHRVYDVVRKIGPGRVSSYKVVAEALGGVSLSRAVGQALRKNPFAPEVPCHRVIAHDCTVGGFQGSRSTDPKNTMVPANVQKKIRVLEMEGVFFDRRTGKLKDEAMCFMHNIA